jgi:hypothetical protein
VARLRNVNVGTVIGEVLEQDRLNRAEAQRRVAAWNAYRESHLGLSEEQWMILDGFIVQPKAKRR